MKKLLKKRCDGTFNSFTTSGYKLHFFETPTGLKLILISDPQANNLSLELQKIYKEIYVEYVAKNPLYKIDDPINCSHFVIKLDNHIRNLQSFKA